VGHFRQIHGQDFWRFRLQNCQKAIPEARRRINVEAAIQLYERTFFFANHMDLQTTNRNEFVRRQNDFLRQVASPEASHAQLQPDVHSPGQNAQRHKPSFFSESLPTFTSLCPY